MSATTDKLAATVISSLPGRDSRLGFSKVDNRVANSVMPWQAGRKPRPEKKKDPVDTIVSGIISGRKNTFNTQLAKKAIARWDNPNAGVAANPYRQVYGDLVRTGLQLPFRGNTMSSLMSRGISGARSAQAAGNNQTGKPQSYDEATSWGGLMRNPGQFADAVLNRYNQQSTAGKIIGNIGAGADLASYAMGGGALKGGLKQVAKGVAPSVATGVAGGILSSGGPSAIDKVLAIPATYAANAQDRTHAEATDYANFNNLMRRGMRSDAATIYPRLWKEQQSGGASSPFSLGRTAGTLLRSQPFR